MNQAADNQKCNVYFLVESTPGDDPDAGWIEHKKREVKDVPAESYTFTYLDFEAMKLDMMITLIGGCSLLAETFVAQAQNDIRNRFDWEVVKTDIMAKALKALQMPVERYTMFKEEYTNESAVVYRFTILIEE